MNAQIKTSTTCSCKSMEIGRQIEFTAWTNRVGILGKLIAEKLFAYNTDDAEGVAYRAIAPFLSTWSLHMDIPMHVETIQVTELSSYINSVRVRTRNSRWRCRVAAPT